MDTRERWLYRYVGCAFRGTSLERVLDDVVPSPEYYVNRKAGIPDENTTWREYLVYNLRHSFGLTENSDLKYVRIVAKIAWSDEVGFDKRDDNTTEREMLAHVIRIMKDDESFFEYVRENVDTMSFNDICEKAKPRLFAMREMDCEGANAVERRNDYEIREVPDFATAKYYGDRSCDKSKLCYAQNELIWKKYTNSGQNRVYVCLKKGWESVEETITDNNPYDEYGTSMIFVFISPAGEIVTSNCRWNHGNVGKYDYDMDHAFTKAKLSETVGMPFDETFKPYTEDVVEAKRKEEMKKIESAVMKLNSGMKPEDAFEKAERLANGFYIVMVADKFNYIDSNGKLLQDIWFSSTEVHFSEGYSMVELNGKWNLILENGELVSDTWFEEMYEGFGNWVKVKLNGKWNCINTDGELLLKEWFSHIGSFHDGFACVMLHGEWNFVNTKGKLLLDEWALSVGNYLTSICMFKTKNGKVNFVNSEGEIISKQYFDDASYDMNAGLYKVYLNGKWNIIRQNGELMFDIWLDKINRFSFGVATVKLNGKYKYIDNTGKFLSAMWFDRELSLIDKVAKVESNGNEYLIDITNGTTLRLKRNLEDISRDILMLKRRVERSRDIRKRHCIRRSEREQAK